MTRDKMIQIIKANSSLNMTQDACDRQAERIADALIRAESDLQEGDYDLAIDQYWCVVDLEGHPIVETASKILTEPVVRFCTTRDLDWEDAKGMGYRLGKRTIEDVSPFEGCPDCGPLLYPCMERTCPLKHQY